jgi:6-phospho-beta-glucosidase
MNRKLKIAVIGAGSTYTPELIDGFLSRVKTLSVSEFYFMDIDRNKMEIVAALCRRMVEAKGIDSKIILTDDLEKAIEGADYVLAQIRVGKLEARIRDEKIPLKYNLLGQETTGAGGFMKAMRTIPVMVKVAETIERLAPDAWLINFSNPSGMIAETLLNHTKVKMIGLCNAPINMIKDAHRRVPEGTKEFDYDFVGLNHLCWITSIYADGKDVLKDQLKGNLEADTLKNIPKTSYSEALLKAVTGLPVGYLNYFYFRDEQVKKCKEAEKTRGEVCKEIEAELLELYKDPELKEKPEVLNKRGGALYSEAAVSLIDAIENDKNEVHVIDVRNNGAYSFMDDDDVVEVKCVVNKKGAFPVKLENFNDNYIIGLMRAVKAYEKLAVKAGLQGDYDAALAALMVHPLIGDFKKAKAVLDEMLEANKQFLPQFFKGE